MSESRIVIEERSLRELAEILREKSGTTQPMDIDEMVEVADSIGLPELEELNVTENGEYTSDAYGYSKVTVDVQPEQEELVITENGEYTPSTYGFNKVTADVQPELEELTVLANGVYTPTVDGYSKVTVECPPGPPESAFKLSGDISRLNWGGKWDWYFNLYGDKITTKDLTGLSYCFSGAASLTKLPFVFNINGTYSMSDAFNGMTCLEESPKVRGNFDQNNFIELANLLNGCERVRDVNDLFEPEMLDCFAQMKCTSAFSCAKACNFYWCVSLRTVPEWFYKFKLCEESTSYPYSSYNLYNNCFYYCSALDEVRDLPVWRCQAAQTSNMFSNIFYYCTRLKDAMFETNPDGTPIETQWKNQTIELDVGYAGTADSITYTNSGITIDKRVTDDASYQALKNDPDWFTTDVAYSRYNHDSAVRTINSLPDTSAYLASAGGTNTIKFYGPSGYKTDGGGCNTLTAEEIAVAAAKGWTVTLV